MILKNALKTHNSLILFLDTTYNEIKETTALGKQLLLGNCTDIEPVYEFSLNSHL